MTNYEVRMQAENKLGLSGFTSILKIITKEECKYGDCVENQMLLIIVYDLSTIGPASEHSRVPSECTRTAGHLPAAAQ